MDDEGRAELWNKMLIVVKGFRNGIVYGAKIRLPHAFVMSMLFREGSFGDKIQWVLLATKQHAWNLGRFVAIFKTILFILRRSFPRVAVEEGRACREVSDWRPFVAGFFGGYVIFGSNDPINNQVFKVFDVTV